MCILRYILHIYTGGACCVILFQQGQTGHLFFLKIERYQEPKIEIDRTIRNPAVAVLKVVLNVPMLK